MDKDLMHLAQITMSNLPKGNATYTDAEVIDAMNKAVEKELSMGMQILKSHSYGQNGELFEAFKLQIATEIFYATRSEK